MSHGGMQTPLLEEEDSFSPSDDVKHTNLVLRQSLAALAMPTNAELPVGHGKIGAFRLCLFGFFSVAGGPFGVEPSVGGAGPLLTLLGLIWFPIMWGVPIALVTAELASIFPANGGCAVFSFHAFQSKVVGFLTGWIGTTASIVTQASYMLLIISYGDAAIPGGMDLFVRVICILALGIISIVANLFRIGALGSINSILVLLVLLPFAVLFFIAIPGSDVQNWGVVLPKREMHLSIYVSNLLWNMQGFATVGAIAGEVHNPSKTYVKGTIGCVVLVALNYAIPILSTTAHCSDWSKWQSGYLSTAAGIIAGSWMSDWISVSATVANLSMLLSSLASAARTLSGMAALALMPQFFSKTIQRTDSPWVAVFLIESLAVLLALFFSEHSNSTGFNLLVDASALLGAIPPVTQLFAFVWLRYSKPDLERPFVVPGGWPGAIFSLVFPLGLFCYLMVTALLVPLVLVAACVVGGGGAAVLMFVMLRRQSLFPRAPPPNTSGGSQYL